MSEPDEITEINDLIDEFRWLEHWIEDLQSDEQTPETIAEIEAMQIKAREARKRWITLCTRRKYGYSADDEETAEDLGISPRHFAALKWREERDANRYADEEDEMPPRPPPMMVPEELHQIPLWARGNSAEGTQGVAMRYRALEDRQRAEIDELAARSARANERLRGSDLSRALAEIDRVRGTTKTRHGQERDRFFSKLSPSQVAEASEEKERMRRERDAYCKNGMMQNILAAHSKEARKARMPASLRPRR